MSKDFKKLTAWIINPYGNIPSESWRDYRSTMIAQAMEKAGHETVWWVSNFVHRSKSYRERDWHDMQVSPNFLVRIVPTTPYYSHISFSRIRCEQNYIRNVYEAAQRYSRPDVIILAEPALFFSKPILKLVDQWNIKLIVDILDLWPELFHIILPPKLSWMGRLLFLPFYCRRTALYRKADAIVAVTDDYLALARNISQKKYMDVVYLGVDVRKIHSELKTPEHLPFEFQNSPKTKGEIWVIYAGTLGNNYDIRSILKAAEILEVKKQRMRLIIAGEGPLKEIVISTIHEKKLTKTVFIGTLKSEVLTYLYSFCDIALSTYIHGSTVSMPVKAFDYMAAGLPVVNSLERNLGEIVRTKNVGIQYESGNPESLANAILQLSSDADMRSTMSKNALNLAEVFDIDIQYKKFVNLIECVCAVS